MSPLHLATAFFCLVSVVSAQSPNWSNRLPVSHPTLSGKNDRLTMVFDPVAKQTLLSGQGVSGATWRWDSKAWSKVTSVGPVGYSRMLYDDKRKRVLMVAGNADVWVWGNEKWTNLNVKTRPQATSGYTVVYDKKRDVVVLFGGYRHRTRSETWEFDGKDWAQRSTGGAPNRMNHVMVYDEARGETVVFGGISSCGGGGDYYDDTWVWNGQYWREHFGITGPGHRQWSGVTYDPKRNVAILYGGFRATSPSQAHADTWEWNGVSWTEVKTAVFPETGKNGGFSTLSFDTTRGVAVLFGGNTLLTQTWEYFNRTGPKATFAAFGSGCKSSTGIPKLAALAGSLPRMGRKFEVELSGLTSPSFLGVAGILGASKSRWNGFNLPLDLKAYGLPGCKMFVSPDQFINLSAVSGRAVWPMQIPNDASLLGGPFYVQALVFDSKVNAFGAVLTNAGEGRMGN